MAPHVNGTTQWLANRNVNNHGCWSTLGALVLDGDASPDDVRELFQPAIDLIPNFRCILHKDGLRFMRIRVPDNEFFRRFGVQGWSWEQLPVGTTFPVEEIDGREWTIESVEDWLGQNMSKQFASDRPPTDVSVVRNFPRAAAEHLSATPITGETCTVVFCRMHHAIGDGYSAVQFMMSVSRADGEAPPRPTPVKKIKTAAERYVMPIVNAIGVLLYWLLTAPWWFAVLSWYTCWPDTKSPFYPCLEERVSVPRFKVLKGSYSVEAMKKAGKSVGGTINDVIIAALTGTARRYLGADFKNTRGFGMTFTMSPRPFGLDAPVERWLPTVGNFVTLMSIPIPVSESCVMKRLRTVVARTARMKCSPIWLLAPFAVTFSDVFVGFFSPTVAWLVDGAHYVCQKTLCLTNVPGPQVVRKVTIGNRDITLSGMVALLNKSGYVTAFSYNGSVKFVACVDHTHLDGKKLENCLQEEWKEIEDATLKIAKAA